MQDLDLIKQALPDFPVHSLIASRWSPRAYSSKPVETEKLQRIFEAARWSASASNQQPWYFMVGFKGDVVNRKIFETMVEFNKLWVVNAPVLVLGISKTTNSKGDPNKYSTYDLGQSVAILSLQAKAEGIYVHQMAGFNADLAASSLEIPDDYKVIVAFTLGYRAESKILHPSLQKIELSPRTRRPISESVFTGSFGHKADFL
jgi:nitroreductase